jgi:hypothetical protein
VNVGDKVSVDIQGTKVVDAEVKEVGDGTVTVIIPATRVVMAVKSELAPEVTPSADSSGTETIVDEVVRTQQMAVEPVPNASGDVVKPSNSDATAAPADAAKVITSSSVPGDNDAAADKAKFEALDPAVQAQITEIVNAHLAAQAAANEQTEE